MLKLLHSKIIEWLILSIIGFIALWAVVVPIIMTINLYGRSGRTRSTNDEFIISCIVPWPSLRLWCYQGQWSTKDTVTILPDNSTFITYGQKFSGFCFVSDLILDHQYK